MKWFFTQRFPREFWEYLKSENFGLLNLRFRKSHRIREEVQTPSDGKILKMFWNYRFPKHFKYFYYAPQRFKSFQEILVIIEEGNPNVDLASRKGHQSQSRRNEEQIKAPETRGAGTAGTHLWTVSLISSSGFPMGNLNEEMSSNLPRRRQSKH